MPIEKYIREKSEQTGNIVYNGVNFDGMEDNKVYKVQVPNAESSTTYALKVLPESRSGDFEESAEHILYRNSLEDWTDSHLIKPLAYWLDPKTKSLYLFLPFLTGEPFDEYLKNKNELTSLDGTRLGIPFAISFAKGIGTAMQQLRESNVIHGDMDDRHYWVTPDGQVYLYDFESVEVNSTENFDRKAEEELAYFETVGTLLTSKHEEIEIDSIFRLVDFYFHDTDKVGESWNTLREVIKYFENVVGLSGQEAMDLQLKTEMDFGLDVLEKYLSIGRRSTMIFTLLILEKKYGANFAKFYANGIMNCMTDPNWSFIPFSKQLEDFLNKEK